MIKFDDDGIKETGATETNAVRKNRSMNKQTIFFAHNMLLPSSDLIAFFFGTKAIVSG